MGAHSFQENSSHQDVRKAYEELVDNARFEEGHSAYSGTIATTRGYRIVSQELVTQAWADELIKQRIHNLSKWEACEVLKIGKPSKVLKRTVTVKGVTNVATLSDVAAVLNISPESINSMKIMSSTPKFDVLTPKAAGEKAWVLQQHGRIREFATKAEATRAMKQQLATAHGWSGDQTFELYQRSAKIKTTATVKEVVSKVEVEIVAGPLEFSSWCFYGWAAS
jgi:hypothetical protein